MGTRLVKGGRLVGTGGTREADVLARNGAVIVDPDVTDPLPLEWLRSRASSSPFVGNELAGWPVTTVLRGEIAYTNHALQGAVRGRAVTYC